MGEKTTIEIDNIRELKQHALDTNKTLKQLINEAIIEKINRERQLLKKESLQLINESTKVGETKKTENKIQELKRILSNAGMLQLVEKEFNRHNLDINNLSRDLVTAELLSDLHTAITLVFDDETADQIIHKIETFFK